MNNRKSQFIQLHKAKQSGFTLIELVIALAIYLILISTLVITSQSASNTLANLENRAIAKRALQNVVIDFKAKAIDFGKKTGQYQMSHFSYDWEINVVKSQSSSARILIGKINIHGKTDVLATQQEVLF